MMTLNLTVMIDEPTAHIDAVTTLATEFAKLLQDRFNLAEAVRIEVSTTPIELRI